MQPTSQKIDLEIEYSVKDGYQIIASSVNCTETKSPSISELIQKAISAAETSSN